MTLRSSTNGAGIDLEGNMQDFMKSISVPMGLDLTDEEGNDSSHQASDWLHCVSCQLSALSSTAEKGKDGWGWFDVRLIRAHLLLEELSESLEALATFDELQLLDGLTDLLYVTVGCAVTYDLPIEAAFLEVHRSNMTKRRVQGDERCRDKGPNYTPPQLERVLEEYHAAQAAYNRRSLPKCQMNLPSETWTTHGVQWPGLS